MVRTKTILITVSRLSEFAGSEITTLELAEAFIGMGWSVCIASFELSGEIRTYIDNAGIKYLELTDEFAFKKTRKFDLAWIHHNATAYRVLLDKNVKISKVIFSSLSYFEPIESPPISGLNISRYLVNSHENLNYFVDKYPAFKSSVSVLHNSAPSAFWEENGSSKSNELRRLAIVSNHIPAEVRALIPLLNDLNVSVEIFGLEGRRERITPSLLNPFDAVISIGKTVQYCIALNIPVYCYDHFGGSGWLDLESFDNERVHNFSGRGSRGKIDVLTLLAELQGGYKNALSFTSDLQDKGRHYFVLEKNISRVLGETEVDFALTDMSETDKNVLYRQNKIYWNQRNISINLQELLSDREGQIRVLKETLTDREDQISRLSEEVEKLRLTEEDLRSMIRNLLPLGSFLRILSRLRVNIAFFRTLLIRSRIVFQHQGVRALFTSVSRYIGRSVSRKKDSFSQKISILENKFQQQYFGSEVIVSFIIPVYDRTDVLEEAIDSALNQTISDLEVIIVTDGSPEETLEVINNYANNPKVRIFNYPSKSGNAVRGRNKGIKEARGRYIAFLDSDDIASPDRIELCLPLLDNHEADVVYGAWQAVIDGSRKIEGLSDGQIIFSPDADLGLLVDTCVPCQSTVIVRKSLFNVTGLLKPNFQYREDHELWARLAFHGAVFRSLPNVLTKLRLHGGNNELNFKANDNHWLDLLAREYKKMGPKPKKIAFILPGVGISGGIAVVFKHVELLMKAGHDAFVINLGDPGDGSWFPSHHAPIVHKFDPRNYIFEGIDLCIATGWSTVEWLIKCKAKRKLYFVQSDERRFFDDPIMKKLIHETYLTPCEYFTEALWIKRMLKDEFGHNASYVPNGIDTTIFFSDIPLEPKRPGRIRILLEGPIDIPFKGMIDSYEAVKELDCDIWIVSSSGKPPIGWNYDRYFEGLPFEEMRKIYSSCDVLLKMSRVEGFFGPPMEAMACGCSVVVAKVSGYDEYIVDGVNALVVNQGDVSGARRAVEKLISDESLRHRLIEAGRETVLEWSWENSSKAMLNLVEQNVS